MLPDIKVNVRADTKQAEAALGRVQKSVGGVAAAAKPATTAMGRLGSVTGQQRFIINNTSNQLGDMAVQLSMGTDAMRVMGFQLPQLLGGFAVMGGALGTLLPILGAVAAIGFPIAAAFIAMGRGANDSEGDLKTLGAALTSFENMAKTTGVTLDEHIIAKFGSSAEAVRGLITALQEAEVAANQAAIGDFFVDVEDQSNNAMKAVEGIARAQADLNNAVLPIQRNIARESLELWQGTLDILGLTADQATRMQGILDAIKASRSTDEMAENLGRARDFAESIGGPIGDALTDAVLAAGKAAGILKDNMEGAEESAKNTLQNMSIANLMAATTGGGRGGDPRAQGATGGMTFAEWEKQFGKKPKKATGDITKEYERLRGAMDPIFRATADLSNAQETLNKALAQGKISQEEYNVTLELAQGKFDRVTGAVMDMGSVFDTIESSMENAFMSMIDGTKSAEDAFRSMAVEIIKELYRVPVVQQLVGTFSSTTGKGSGIMGFLGNLLSFEGGGSTGSGPRSGGIDGRGGSLAIVHPQETIIDHTKVANTNGGGGVVVNQTINVDAGVSQTVRAEMISMLPQFKEQTIQAVTDSSRRSARA